MNNGKSVDALFRRYTDVKKLFKYEFKSTAKIMLILYAILIIATSVGSVVLYSLDLDQAGESKLASILSVSAIVLYILAIFAVLIVMYVYLCVHFYRTMYSAQGYLTHAPGKNTCSFSRKTDNLLRVDVSLHGSDDCLHRGAYRQRLPRNRMAGFYFRLGGVIRSGRIFLPFHLPDGIGRNLLLLNLPALGVCKRFDRTAFLQQ